jgi:hypothetical protein
LQKQAYGRREEISRRRAEQKQRTIEQRLRYNLGRWNQILKGELEPKVQLGPGAKLVSELLTMNSGIAAGAKHLQPRMRVVGVQAELAPAYYLS